MAASSKRFHYSVAKLMHWVVGAIVVFNLLSGWRLDSFEPDVKQVLVMIHASVGTVIFAGMLFRWWWRSSRNLYAPPRWWKRPAMLLQWVLYPLVLAQVVIGLAQAAFVDYDIDAFGLVPYAALAAANEAMQGLLLQFHQLMAWLLILLIAAHGVERGRLAFIEDAGLITAQEPGQP